MVHEETHPQPTARQASAQPPEPPRPPAPKPASTTAGFDAPWHRKWDPKATPSPQSTPPSKPAPVPLEELTRRWQKEADAIENALVPAQLREIIVGGQDGLSVEGVRHYLAERTQGVEDPVEKMMLRQLIVGHHQVMRLYVAANDTTNLDAIKTYNAAAARLQAELRLLAMSVRLYRTPVMAKQITHVEQQNIANQQSVAFVQQGEDKTMKCRDSELVSNEGNHGHDEHNKKPEPGAGRLREPQETRAFDTARA